MIGRPARARAILTILTLLSAAVYALEPEWVSALTADPIAGPVVAGGNVYLVLDDRTVDCLSPSGAYLWRKPLSGKPAPFLGVLASGQVLVCSESGVISSFNADGSFLWRMSGSGTPAFPPLEGRDGRVFIPFNNRIVCVSPQGCVKWALRLEEPITQPLSETGDGDLIAVGGLTLFRISPFGELLERTVPEESIRVVFPIPGGYLTGSSSGSIRAYDVRDGRSGGTRPATECIWKISTPAEPLAFALLEGTVVAIHADGIARSCNVTDGVPLWSQSTGVSGASGARIQWDYGQYTLSLPGSLCALSSGGKVIWQRSIGGLSSAPVISDDGRMYAYTTGWRLSCYLPETRIKREKKHRKNENYGILNGKSTVFGISFMSDFAQNADFFDRVERDISAGTVGSREVEYARRLAEILSGDDGTGFGGRSITGAERGRAASLLGQLGSSEYRDILLLAAHGSDDESLSIGVLYGIGATGCDTDGASLTAIRTVSSEAGFSNDMAQRAAIDALYSVLRYSAGEIAREGARTLSAYLGPPYSADVQNHARKTLGDILK